MKEKGIRLRDFVMDMDGWLYAVAAYDNREKVGCILRYVPDKTGDRSNSKGECYRKLEFEEAYSLIEKEKPEYSDLIQRVPRSDIKEVLKPDERIERIASDDKRVRKLIDTFSLPKGVFGVTGSMLCDLAGPYSDIDGVVYGNFFFNAQKKLEKGIETGVIEGLDDALWHKVYDKRKPELSYDEFIAHEMRKWNRGQVDGTYFDLLYTRSYDNLSQAGTCKGEVLGRDFIEGVVSDASLGYDSPAVYEIEHEQISRVLSFTHTYTGQALEGETIEACGVVERHGDENWLVVGTTREAKGEYIRSLSLLELV